MESIKDEEDISRPSSVLENVPPSPSRPASAIGNATEKVAAKKIVSWTDFHPILSKKDIKEESLAAGSKDSLVKTQSHISAQSRIDKGIAGKVPPMKDPLVPVTDFQKPRRSNDLPIPVPVKAQDATMLEKPEGAGESGERTFPVPRNTHTSVPLTAPELSKALGTVNGLPAVHPQEPLSSQVKTSAENLPSRSASPKDQPLSPIVQEKPQCAPVEGSAVLSSPDRLTRGRVPTPAQQYLTAVQKLRQENSQLKGVELWAALQKLRYESHMSEEVSLCNASVRSSDVSDVLVEAKKLKLDYSQAKAPKVLLGEGKRQASQPSLQPLQTSILAGKNENSQTRTRGKDLQPFVRSELTRPQSFHSHEEEHSFYAGYEDEGTYTSQPKDQSKPGLAILQPKDKPGLVTTTPQNEKKATFITRNKNGSLALKEEAESQKGYQSTLPMKKPLLLGAFQKKRASASLQDGRGPPPSKVNKTESDVIQATTPPTSKVNKKESNVIQATTPPTSKVNKKESNVIQATKMNSAAPEAPKDALVKGTESPAEKNSQKQQGSRLFKKSYFEEFLKLRHQVFMELQEGSVFKDHISKKVRVLQANPKQRANVTQSSLSKKPPVSPPRQRSKPKFKVIRDAQGKYVVVDVTQLAVQPPKSSLSRFPAFNFLQKLFAGTDKTHVITDTTSAAAAFKPRFGSPVLQATICQRANLMTGVCLSEADVYKSFGRQGIVQRLLSEEGSLESLFEVRDGQHRLDQASALALGRQLSYIAANSSPPSTQQKVRRSRRVSPHRLPPEEYVKTDGVEDVKGMAYAEGHHAHKLGPKQRPVSAGSALRSYRDALRPQALGNLQVLLGSESRVKSCSSLPHQTRSFSTLENNLVDSGITSWTPPHFAGFAKPRSYDEHEDTSLFQRTPKVPTFGDLSEHEARSPQLVRGFSRAGDSVESEKTSLPESARGFPACGVSSEHATTARVSPPGQENSSPLSRENSSRSFILEQEEYEMTACGSVDRQSHSARSAEPEYDSKYQHSPPPRTEHVVLADSSECEILITLKLPPKRFVDLRQSASPEHDFHDSGRSSAAAHGFQSSLRESGGRSSSLGRGISASVNLGAAGRFPEPRSPSSKGHLFRPYRRLSPEEEPEERTLVPAGVNQASNKAQELTRRIGEGVAEGRSNHRYTHTLKRESVDTVLLHMCACFDRAPLLLGKTRGPMDKLLVSQQRWIHFPYTPFIMSLDRCTQIQTGDR
jgi:hypothetical protein